MELGYFTRKHDTFEFGFTHTFVRISRVLYVVRQLCSSTETFIYMYVLLYYRTNKGDKKCNKKTSENVKHAQKISVAFAFQTDTK